MTFTEAMKGFTVEDLTVSGATAGAVMSTIDNITYYLSLTPSADGTITVDIAADAAVSVASGLGNEAATRFSIVYDTTAPAAPASLDLAADDDTGVFEIDNLTKLTTGLTITGTAVAGTKVTILSNAMGALATATVGGTGAWSVDIALTAGTHQVTATAADAAGNVSVPSLPLSITVDTTAPSAPVILTPAQGADTGKNLRPKVSWAAVDGASGYDLMCDDQSDFSSAEVSLSGLTGTFINPGEDLPVNTAVPVGTRYYLRMRTTDIAGNVGAWSDADVKRYVNVGRYDNDFNGDGFSDAIVGASGADPSGINSGRAYIFYGGAAADTVVDVTFTGASAGDYFGHSVAGAGDVNGDGYADAVVGAPQDDTSGTGSGRTYLYYGGSTVDTAADVTFTGVALDDQFGFSVSGAGDVNADGYADVIVGAMSNGANDNGSAYVFYGGSTVDASADVTFTGSAWNDRLGDSVAGAGDVNADGYADVIVGAFQNDAGGSDNGRAYLYHGGASMNAVADVTFTGAAPNDYLGHAVAGAGDVNGDGFADVIVGAPENDAGGTNRGSAFVYYGGSNMNAVVDMIFTGAAANDYFGDSVAGAGDVNNDGYADIIVGAHWNDAGGIDSGRAYLFYGGSSVDAAVDVTFTGAAADDRFGESVSGTGDVNADGYADVIIGAYQNDAGGVANRGSANLYHGGSSMDAVADVTFTGAAAGDNFGISVARVGEPRYTRVLEIFCLPAGKERFV